MTAPSIKLQQRAWVLGVLCVLALSSAACTGDTAPPMPPPQLDAGGPASTLIVLPDTQFYSCAYPQIFQSQTQWIVDHKRDEGIAAVIHTGDIVDGDVHEQWQVASASLHRLDGVVPYLVTTGNHDMRADRSSYIASYFDPAGSGAQVRDPGRFDNAYQVVELAGQAWLLLGLEFAPRHAVLQWAGEVLAAHAALPAIVFTHAYLYSDGQRYDRAITPLQPYHPDGYGFTPQEGVNDGEDIFRKLIEPHENVRLVVCGHVIPDGTARSVVTRSSGSVVHQVLANYQLCDRCPCSEVEGGGGYLRRLRFDPEVRAIDVSTYSPHLGRSLRDSENEFRLEL